MAGAGCDDCGASYSAVTGLHGSKGGIGLTPLLVVAPDLSGGAGLGADVPVVHRPKLGIEWFTPEQPAIVRLELRTKPRMAFLY